jgi:hypothetical protein
MNYLPDDIEVQVVFLSNLPDGIPSLIIGSNYYFGVPGGAFHSDVLLTQALSYHMHHELVTQFRLLHYGS